MQILALCRVMAPRTKMVVFIVVCGLLGLFGGFTGVLIGCSIGIVVGLMWVFASGAAAAPPGT